MASSVFFSRPLQPVSIYDIEYKAEEDIEEYESSDQSPPVHYSIEEDIETEEYFSQVLGIPQEEDDDEMMVLAEHVAASVEEEFGNSILSSIDGPNEDFLDLSTFSEDYTHPSAYDLPDHLYEHFFNQQLEETQAIDLQVIPYMGDTQPYTPLC